MDYPADTNDLQHEVELVIAVGEEMSVFGFGVGVDLTRRDIQGQAKKDSKPWFRGKVFWQRARIQDYPIGKEIGLF